jgi:hypothetical protein
MTPAAIWEASQGRMHISLHLTMWVKRNSGRCLTQVSEQAEPAQS